MSQKVEYHLFVGLDSNDALHRCAFCCFCFLVHKLGINFISKYMLEICELLYMMSTSVFVY